MEKTDNRYYNLHQKLIKKYGKAYCCENPDCISVSPKRYEWALLKGHEYSCDKYDYIQLCPSCHRKYDFTEKQRERQSKARTGKPANNQRSVVQCDLEGVELCIFPNVQQASTTTKTNRTSISQCLTGKYKTANNFIWKKAITN